MDVSQDILAPLTNCKGLKKLHIRSECGGEDDHTIVPQALYDFCQACRKLERLHLLFAR